MVVFGNVDIMKRNLIARGSAPTLDPFRHMLNGSQATDFQLIIDVTPRQIINNSHVMTCQNQDFQIFLLDSCYSLVNYKADACALRGNEIIEKISHT